LKYTEYILPVIIFLILSYTGWKDYEKEGLLDQSTHQTMTELGLLNLKNSGVVWYGTYSYFNNNPVTDLMYKTRDCREVKSRGKFYPGHNKYNYFNDTLKFIVGKLWKPSIEESKILTNYIAFDYKGVTIYERK